MRAFEELGYLASRIVIFASIFFLVFCITAVLAMWFWDIFVSEGIPHPEWGKWVVATLSFFATVGFRHFFNSDISGGKDHE